MGQQKTLGKGVSQMSFIYLWHFVLNLDVFYDKDPRCINFVDELSVEVIYVTSLFMTAIKRNQI